MSYMTTQISHNDNVGVTSMVNMWYLKSPGIMKGEFYFL